MKITEIIFLFFILPVFGRDYSGYRVFRIYNANEYEIVDFETWGKGKTWIDVMLSPDQELPKGVEYNLLISNVQDRIDQENVHGMKHSRHFHKMGLVPNSTQVFKDYQDYDTLISFLDSLPLLSSKVSIGKTYLGREIYAFNFGYGKKRIVINGGIHAREWISPAVVTWIAYWLNNDPTGKALLEKFTWSIIPVVNVDGYDYTRSTDRLWRKNRQPNAGSRCVGIDPNRNFGFEWGTGGASGNACADDFRGHKSFEAPCTVAIAEFVASFPKDEVLVYFDFHSYSQLWLYPYGYNCGLKIPEYNIVDTASQIAIAAIAKVGGTKFIEGPLCNTIYKASGSSTDHMYSLGVPFSFGVELRDKGYYGFILRTLNKLIP